MENKFILCGLEFIHHYPNYFTINKNHVIMQDSRLEQILELHKKGYEFTFEEFKILIENYLVLAQGVKKVK